MTYLETMIAKLLRKIEYIKGDRTLNVLRSHQDPNDFYKAVSSDGSVIQIYCIEVTYRVNYVKWWIRDRNISIYRVFCVCSEDVPASLKEKLSSDFTISQLLHFLSYREDQKKAAIAAYVDVILSEHESMKR